MLRCFAAVLVLATASLVARAADEENPYKSAKKGDYVVYTLTTAFAGQNVEGTLTQTIADKTEKEATVKISMVLKFGGNEMKLPEQEQKIDLTKPYDPTKMANLPPGVDAKVEKLKDGKEKVKVNGKEYDATWTTYKLKATVQKQDIDADLKVWMSKDVPLGMVKMTTNMEIAGQKVEAVTELKESGNKK